MKFLFYGYNAVWIHSHSFHLKEKKGKNQESDQQARSCWHTLHLRQCSDTAPCSLLPSAKAGVYQDTKSPQQPKLLHSYHCLKNWSKSTKEGCICCALCFIRMAEFFFIQTWNCHHQPSVCCLVPKGLNTNTTSPSPFTKTDTNPLIFHSIFWKQTIYHILLPHINLLLPVFASRFPSLQDPIPCFHTVLPLTLKRLQQALSSFKNTLFFHKANKC